VRNAAPILKGHDLFNGVHLTRAQVEAQARNLLAQTGLDTTELERVALRPSLTAAVRLADKLDDLKAALLARDGGRAADALIEMNQIGKHHAVQVGFERIRHLLMAGDSVPLVSIRSIAGQLRDIVHTHQLPGERDAAACRPAWRELSGTVRGLQRLMPKGADLTPKARARFEDRLRKYMSEAEVEAKTRALS